MTLTKAITKAEKLAAKNGEDYFVLRDDDRTGYEVCDTFTLWMYGDEDPVHLAEWQEGGEG